MAKKSTHGRWAAAANIVDYLLAARASTIDPLELAAHGIRQRVRVAHHALHCHCAGCVCVQAAD